MNYGVTVQVEWTNEEGWQGTTQVPYFQVQALNEASAGRIATVIVDSLGYLRSQKEVHIHVSTVRI